MSANAGQETGNPRVSNNKAALHNQLSSSGSNLAGGGGAGQGAGPGEVGRDKYGSPPSYPASVLHHHPNLYMPRKEDQHSYWEEEVTYR